jgi:hypothetical protein
LAHRDVTNGTKHVKRGRDRRLGFEDIGAQEISIGILHAGWPISGTEAMVEDDGNLWLRLVKVTCWSSITGPAVGCDYVSDFHSRHRFPPVVIQHSVWLYLRFPLSYRDVEELLAERGLDVSYETVRSWVLKFGPMMARRLRQRRPRPGDRWHLDEMVVRIAGKRMYPGRAVDHEGEILDVLVQRR